MEVHCNCGNMAVLRCSWTNKNPGRRFWACNSVFGRCSFFLWEDPPMCARSKVIIPGLLRRIKEYEARRKREKLVILSILIVVFAVWVCK